MYVLSTWPSPTPGFQLGSTQEGRDETEKQNKLNTTLNMVHWGGKKKEFHPFGYVFKMTEVVEKSYTAGVV
jgi:hypothetical protein